MITSAGRLLERERELQRIGAALDRARDGEGGLVVVEGPPGIGKTRLSRAARQEAEERGFVALAACGAELEREYPFGVVRQLLEATLRAASAEERDRLLDGAAALAAAAVLPEVALDGGKVDEAFGAFHGLYWLCANLAERQPLMLVADDLQWVDEPSLRFLGFLVHRLEALPIVVLVTRRTGTETGGALADDGAAETLQLRPLSTEGVASFLRLAADGDLDDSFTAACRAATAGNPFLLDQLVHALVEHGAPFTSDSVPLVQTVGPEAVSTGVLARLRRLGTATNALARAAAVLGDDTQLALAAELAGLDESTGAEAAAALVEAGVLEDARPLRFEHPIVRGAVEAALSAGERARLHGRAAAILAERGAPAAEVAVHLLPTDPGTAGGGGSSWIVAVLAEAAQQAVAGGAPAAAIPLLERALAEPATAERSQLLLELGRVESRLGRAGAIEHLEAAHRLAVGPVERGTCALHLGWARMVDQSDAPHASAMLEEAIAETAPVDRELALELEAAHAALLSIGEQPADAAHRLERFAELPGRTRAECALLGQLAHLRMDVGRSAAECADLAERVVANDRILEEVGFDASWLLSCILVLRAADRVETVLRALTVSVEAAQRRGAVAGFAIASGLRAFVSLANGDVRAAEVDARAALDSASVWSWLWLPAVAGVTDVLVESARPDEAERLLTDHDALGELPKVRPATVLLIARARLRATQGQLQSALRDLEAARGRLELVTSQSIVGIDGSILLALVLHGLGEVDEAERVVARALGIARAWGVPSHIGNVLRAQGLIAGGSEGRALLEQAVESLERSPRRLDHARALADLGAALRRQGDRVAARAPLRQALDLAHACGGVAVAEQAREELVATGVRVRRDAQSGLESLTPSERRIAERAVAGASNREIAQALFVTVKTVEMHLGHAYRKLGISSRSQLAAAIRELESQRPAATANHRVGV